MKSVSYEMVADECLEMQTDESSVVTIGGVDDRISCHYRLATVSLHRVHISFR